MAAFDGTTYAKGTRVVISNGQLGTIAVAGINAVTREPSGVYMVRLDDGSLVQQHHSEVEPFHPAAELTGGSIPEHVPGAYPRLSCCGGSVALMTSTDPESGEDLPYAAAVETCDVFDRPLVSGRSYAFVTDASMARFFPATFEYEHVEDDGSRTIVVEHDGEHEGYSPTNFDVISPTIEDVAHDAKAIRRARATDAIERAQALMRAGDFLAAERELHEAAYAAHWLAVPLGPVLARAAGLDNPAGAGESVEAFRG